MRDTTEGDEPTTPRADARLKRLLRAERRLREVAVRRGDWTADASDVAELLVKYTQLRMMERRARTLALAGREDGVAAAYRQGARYILGMTKEQVIAESLAATAAEAEDDKLLDFMERPEDHVPVAIHGYHDGPKGTYCKGCVETWPCATRRALDMKQKSEVKDK